MAKGTIAVKEKAITPKYKWEILKKAPKKYEKDFGKVIGQLLFNRNIKSAEVADFLNPDYVKIHDPFLLKDMEKAVKRIRQAIVKAEKIVVYGDYDVDGITSTAILVDYLKSEGARVEHYLPHREDEGYGLNSEAIKQLVKEGAGLLITVDCGISNAHEVELANSRGLNVIIVDHHTIPKEIPKALVIIHPLQKDDEYPYKDMAAVGLVFKLVQALSGNDERIKWYLDLVALGTIADVAPLSGENRILTKYGLIVLGKTKRVGLEALAEAASTNLKKIDSRTVAFQLAPRLNAAGRLEHADLSLKLLQTEDEGMARKLAGELEMINQERRKAQDNILRMATDQVEAEFKNDFSFVLADESWRAGVVGIAAGRLAEEYNRPTILLGEKGGEAKGSGRSIGGFDLIGALEVHREMFLKFGGHKQAVGLSISVEEIKNFRISLNEYAKTKLRGIDLTPKLMIEAELGAEDLNLETWREVRTLGPFGAGNPEPIFVTTDVEVSGKQVMGSDGRHLKFGLKGFGNNIEAVSFGANEVWLKEIESGQKLDIAYHLKINQFNGRTSLQLRLLDLKSAAEQ